MPSVCQQCIELGPLNTFNSSHASRTAFVCGSWAPGMWGKLSSTDHFSSHREAALQDSLQGTFDSPDLPASSRYTAVEQPVLLGLQGLFKAAPHGAASMVLPALMLQLVPPRREHCCTILHMCAWMAGILC